MGIADKTYWLNENKELVTEEPTSGIVLVNAGQEISPDLAEKYGIGKVAQTEEKAAEEVSEEKTARPSANKSKKPASNK